MTVVPAELDRDACVPRAALHPRTTAAPKLGVDATPRSRPTRTERCVPARDPPCDAESAAPKDRSPLNTEKPVLLLPGSCSSAPYLPPKVAPQVRLCAAHKSRPVPLLLDQFPTTAP